MRLTSQVMAVFVAITASSQASAISLQADELSGGFLYQTGPINGPFDFGFADRFETRASLLTQGCIEPVVTLLDLGPGNCSSGQSYLIEAGDFFWETMDFFNGFRPTFTLFFQDSPPPGWINETASIRLPDSQADGPQMPAVPLPAGGALLLAGLTGLVLMRRKRPV